MILAKIWYEIYDRKLLTIIEDFKTWRHYQKNCKHKVFLYYPIIITPKNLWTPKTWDFIRFANFKHFFNITFRSIIIKAKLIQLLMLYCVFLRDAYIRKKFFKLEIPKFFTGYNLCWSMLVFLVSLASLFIF